jgi:hypothetical protein
MFIDILFIVAIVFVFGPILYNRIRYGKQPDKDTNIFRHPGSGL